VVRKSYGLRLPHRAGAERKGGRRRRHAPAHRAAGCRVPPGGGRCRDNGARDDCGGRVLGRIGRSPVASATGAEALAATREPGAPPPSQTRLGGLALSAVNGLWGDTLAGNATGARPSDDRARERRDVPLDRASVAAAFPDATSRLVVFLTGWPETTRRGGAAPRRRRGAGSYGDRLHRDLEFSPVYVRYNSGLRVATPAVPCPGCWVTDRGMARPGSRRHADRTLHGRTRAPAPATTPRSTARPGLPRCAPW